MIVRLLISSTHIFLTCLFMWIALTTHISGQARKPIKSHIKTRWAEDVTPDRVLPEYPRPMMVRDQWLNLNGLWDYAITGREEGWPAHYDGKILVPFPIESVLSGIKKTVNQDNLLWYHRTFELPPDWENKRILLHFEAVDWETTVWVNDFKIGNHQGGYDPFTLDITHALEVSGIQELTLSVWDPADEGHQPRGKQRIRPRGIWYTAVTGIWQTVWLEPVEKVGYIHHLEQVPDIDTQTLKLTAHVNSKTQNLLIRSVVKDAHTIIAETEGIAGQPLTLKIPNPQLWSPDSPALYELEVTLFKGEKQIDRVDSYFGMRKIALTRDQSGVLRLSLNKKIYFQFGPLDQGFWPDGIYRAPTDEALRYDIKVMKDLGFNMLRKHVKVESRRFYTWCDKLGILVWQDMPSGDIASRGESEWGKERNAQSSRQFELEFSRIITTLYNHPSIVVWIPFNEGWGQYDTERLTASIKEKDPSRLVISASGFMDFGVGDAHSVHAYPGPAGAPREENRARVLGEFGGLGLPVKDHTWSESGWGYRSFKNIDQLTEGYENLLQQLRLYISEGLSAAVYTQITDVESELNGLMTYDRAVIKIDPDRMTKLAKMVYETEPNSYTLIPIISTSQDSSQLWYYTFEKPSNQWNKLNYDDTSWLNGPGGFGNPEALSPVVRTEWTTPEIWLRKTFTLSGKVRNPYLIFYHDMDQEAKIFLNGNLIAEGPGHQHAYTLIQLDKRVRKGFNKGRNILAIHGTKKSRRQYIDAGMVEISNK